MDNFASASMVRLLARGMAERGMAVSGFKLTPAAARVPLQQKRQLVGAIVEKGGLSLLLALARQVHLIAGEPLHQALVCAADPLDFFARWQRLERYVHAVHRLRPVHREPGVLSLQHIALKPVGATPMPAESLAVMGVWIGALETLGTPGLSFEVDGLLLSEAPGEDALRRCAGAGRLNRWTLRWAQGASTGVAPRAGAEPTSQLDPQSASLSLPWCGPANA